MTLSRSRTRAVTLVVAGALLVGLVGCSGEGTRTIGLLASPGSPVAEGALTRLAELGWEEGANLTVVAPGWESADELPDVAAQLLEADVDVILTLGAPASIAAVAAAEGSGVPVVVIATENNRASLERPGVTGILGTTAPGKAMEFLLQVVPVDTVVVGVVGDAPSESSFEQMRGEIETLGVTVVRVDLASVESAAEDLRAHVGDADAVMTAASAALLPAYGAIIEMALEEGVPFLSDSHQQSEAGAFMSYGWVPSNLGTQVAPWVDDLLNGVPVDELPMGSFDLVLSFNAGTADSLGIEIPRQLVSQATLYP